MVTALHVLWEAMPYVKLHPLSFQVTAEAAKLMVQVEPVKLYQIFLNLFENAAQQSPEGTEIRVEISSRKTWCQFRIIDRGSGIPANYLTQIFDPFVSARKGGTGLGLTLVKNITEALGGTVAVRNNENGPGCTAQVLLPIFRKKKP